MKRERITLTSTARARLLQGAEQVAPGIWIDREGATHYSVPELARFFGVSEAEARTVLDQVLKQIHGGDEDFTVIEADPEPDG